MVENAELQRIAQEKAQAREAVDVAKLAQRNGNFTGTLLVDSELCSTTDTTEANRLTFQSSNETSGADDTGHVQTNASTDSSPSTTRTLQSWQQQLDVWASCLCQDVTGAWYESIVSDVRQASSEDNGYVLIHYLGWCNSFDEWLPRTSVRFSSNHPIA